VKYHGLTAAWQRPRLDVKAVTKRIASAKTRELAIARLNGKFGWPILERNLYA
jgi:hypothetical protein